MREVQKRQLQFGQIPVDKVWLDPKSRDDIPAVLKGLQHLYKEKQEELFMLLEKHILPGTHRGVGRPGMEMWRILVLGVLKQGLGCDFDRLHNLANHHETVRAMLGHSEFADKTHYELQTIVDNVSLMRPELLVEVGDWWWRAATRSREKSLASGCAGGVTRSWWRPTCIIPPIWVYCGMRCGV